VFIKHITSDTLQEVSVHIFLLSG